MSENPQRGHDVDDAQRRPVMIGVPRLSRTHLSRPRLLALMDGDGGGPLRVLHAAAGYGKTSLLAEWARTRPAPGGTLWITVDAECRTRRSFWAQVVSLLHTTGLARGTAFEGLLVTTDMVADLTAILLHGFESLPRPLTLVVDGFENVSDPAVEADLLRLVRHTSHLSLVIGTRTPTELGSTTTALAVDAVVLDAYALAFTADEVAQLATHVGSPLTAEQIAALHDASDGWPLAVRAGVQAAREHPWPAAKDRDAISRLQRMLIDDLVGKPGFQDLVTLSVVDDVTAEQAALLGVDLAGTPILAEVEERGLGSWEEGASGRRFRLQPVVRQALSVELSEDDLRQAHRTLVPWYETHGHHARAFASAAVAQEWARARAILITSFHQVVSELDRTWLRGMEIPRQVQRSYPVLALVLGLGQYGRGDVGKAIRTLSASVANAEWKHLSDRGHVSVDQLWVQGVLTIGLRFAGRDELVQPALRRLQAMLPRAVGAERELLYFRRLFATQAATSYLLLDRDDDAARVLADGPSARHLTGHHDRHPESLAVLVHASGGRIVQAREALVELVDPLVPRHFNVGFYAVPKHLGAAYVHLEEHRPDAAAAELEYVQPHWPTVEWWPLVLHVRTLQRWLAAGPAAALRTLDAGLAEKTKKPLGAAMRALLTALRVELLLALGLLADARQLIAARKVRSYPRLAVARTRSLLLDGDLDRALALATAPEHEHRTTPRIRVEMRLLAASARLRSGDRARALRDFEIAVALGIETGLRTPFAAMPRQDFGELAAATPGTDGLRADIERFPVPFPEPEQLVSLTSRELVVLTELASPASLSVIAARLSVAPGTVKTQCRSIYRKLGVSGRAAAVAEARRRGIL